MRTFQSTTSTFILGLIAISAAAQSKAAQDQAEAQKQQQLATYQRANAACLEGRGYALK